MHIFTLISIVCLEFVVLFSIMRLILGLFHITHIVLSAATALYNKIKWFLVYYTEFFFIYQIFIIKWCETCCTQHMKAEYFYFSSHINRLWYYIHLHKQHSILSTQKRFKIKPIFAAHSALTRIVYLSIFICLLWYKHLWKK